ncbi:response regulator [Candidatus Pacearchaeota archaeon]|nr:response regulator [Candidatus Pacearchaeota archaeon]
MNLKKNKLEKKILVVEDNEVNQELFKFVLEEYSLDIVENGIQAVEKCKNNKYGLVLMDIKMPKMNGYEATREIRKFDLETPIIAVTAQVTGDVEKKCLNNGMNGYLARPTENSDLKSLVKKYIK